MSGNEIGQTNMRRVLPGIDARPRRRAHRAGGIGVGKFHAFRGKPVHGRRLMKLVAVATRVGPAHVVD